MKGILNVPDKGYSRNVSCILHLLSTFIIIIIIIITAIFPLYKEFLNSSSTNTYCIYDT
jgi:hypothetical protein